MIGLILCLQMVEEAVKEVIPIGRMGTTQDIAYMATFLCSDAGRPAPPSRFTY